MAKFHGIIGFGIESIEVEPGVWEEMPILRSYYGDVRNDVRRMVEFGETNNIEISNTISIVADAYAKENIHSMRYIEWRGSKWKIKTVEVKHPRLILHIGGVWNG